MDNHGQFLSSEAIQMLVSSLTNSGRSAISEIEVERFLNALARAQSGVPTGLSPNGQNDSRN